MVLVVEQIKYLCFNEEPSLIDLKDIEVRDYIFFTSIDWRELCTFFTSVHNSSK